MPRSVPIFLLLIIFAGCETGANQEMAPSSQPLIFESFASPAPDGSRLPYLTATPDGSVVMSWVEPDSVDGHSLKFARRTDSGWSDAQHIASGKDWFINWADFPSVVALDDFRMAAHFLQKSGPDTYAYDVMITLSSDAGQTWSDPVKLHDDQTQSEHGFVSLTSDHNGDLFAVWLDGRNTSGMTHGETNSAAMTLRGAFISDDGRIFPSVELDNRTCDCCQTAAVRSAESIVVTYRDRSEDEIRDISVVRYVDGSWSDPVPVHTDSWQIDGCPVNGPALAGIGSDVAVAWFTAARDTAAVYVNFSGNGGASFGNRVRMDDGNPSGRVGLVGLPDASTLVSWIEKTDAGAEVRVRRVWSDGTVGESSLAGPVDPARASGFPQIAVVKGVVLVAWTETGDSPRITIVSSRLDQHGSLAP